MGKTKPSNGRRLSYKKSDIMAALLGRSNFRIKGFKIADMPIIQLAYWALSHTNEHTRLGCVATLLDKTNNGHVVRTLLNSLEERIEVKGNGSDAATNSVSADRSEVESSGTVVCPMDQREARVPSDGRQEMGEGSL